MIFKFKLASSPNPVLKRTLTQQLSQARGNDGERDDSNMEQFLTQLQESEGNITFIQPQYLEYCDELGRGAFGAVWKVS